MTTIIPAILATNENDYKKDISRYINSSFFQGGWIHIDFMDNRFVPNKSIEPALVAKYPVDMQKEAHLMVQNPLEWIPKVIEAGFGRAIIHKEAGGVKECLEAVEFGSLQKGVALNMDTPVESVVELLPLIDLILFMSITPGFQGQQFQSDVLEKIKKLAGLRNEQKLNFQISVDGGVGAENARLLQGAGVDNLIVGSYLLKGDIDANLEKIWEELR